MLSGALARMSSPGPVSMPAVRIASSGDGGLHCRNRGERNCHEQAFANGESATEEAGRGADDATEHADEDGDPAHELCLSGPTGSGRRGRWPPYRSSAIPALTAASTAVSRKKG